MEKHEETPALKQVVGAMLFGAPHALTVAQLRKAMAEVAEIYGDETRAYAHVKDAEIEKAVRELALDLGEKKVGFDVGEGADGFKFQSDPAVGPWLRHIRNEQRPQRLSRPALETLAIIAYRQPAVRSEIESVRGVNVDHTIRMLLEMQLIRIVGRSELPGRPLLYGTTTNFLEHFGLKDVKELPGIEQLSRMEMERQKKDRTAAPPAPEGAPVPEADPAGTPAGASAEAEAGTEPVEPDPAVPETADDAGGAESAP